MMDLGGGEPTVGDRRLGSCPPHFVGELGPDRAECSVGDRAPERPASHALLHGGEIQVFDHHLAVGGRQHGGELVGRLLPEVDAAPVEASVFGFRYAVPSGAGDASGHLPPDPVTLDECRPQGGGVGNFEDGAIGVGDGGQGPHPEIDAGPLLGRRRTGMVFDDATEGDEQPPPPLAEGGVEDAGRALAEQALQSARALHRAQRADHGQGDPAPVGLDSDGARGEPHPGVIRLPTPELGEPDRTALALSLLGVGPVLESYAEVGDPGGIRLLGVLRPPGRDRALLGVPSLAQGVEVPGHRLVGGIARAGIHIGLHLAESPVEGVASAPELGADQGGAFVVVRPLDLEAEAARDPAVGDGELPLRSARLGRPLDRPGGHESQPIPVTAAVNRAARFFAARRP